MSFRMEEFLVQRRKNELQTLEIKGLRSKNELRMEGVEGQRRKNELRKAEKEE